jgi:hypothetical protein
MNEIVYLLMLINIDQLKLKQYNLLRCMVKTHVRNEDILHQTRLVSCNVLSNRSIESFVKRLKLMKQKSNKLDIKNYHPQGFRRNSFDVNVRELQIHPILSTTSITYGT